MTTKPKAPTSPETGEETKLAPAPSGDPTERTPPKRDPHANPGRARRAALLTSILIVSACGITYELLIGAIASYLLGGSVTQFSLTIGVFLASMGIGAYLSRWVNDDLLDRFIEVEIAISLAGGSSGALLFWAFSYTGFYHLMMFGLIILVGTLIGLEIPLLTRYLERFSPLKESLASVFSLDYLGSLFASILFPFFFLPTLGIFKTSLVVGLFNVAIAVTTLALFWPYLRRRRRAVMVAMAVAAGLVTTLALSSRLMGAMEAKLYRDEIIYTAQSRYQRLVLTRYRDDIRLYLNGGLQFSSRDEYRYHESLVHPVMRAAANHEHILIIGGGDGLAIKELLKYKGIRKITLVDIDPAVTQLARRHPTIAALNGKSLDDPRVRIVNRDAYLFLEQSSDLYSAVIIDLPDPKLEALAKLYSTSFYRLVRRHLSPGGAAVTQATSPLFARRAFWCIATTIERSGFVALPYHAYIPSFGDWGFVLFTTRQLEHAALEPRVPTRFLKGATFERIFEFPPDIARITTEVSRLDKPMVMHYYQEGWYRWF